MLLPPGLSRRHLLQAAMAGVALPLGCRPEGASTPAARASWATGGTAAMTGRATYPNPFAGASSSCRLTCAATIGPCHTASPERADISDGWDGLPLRLALRVVDEDCRPVRGAIAEVWHTNHRGGYSGDIVQMCTMDEADKAKQFFRGYLRTDDDGRVNFDTTFPGWYRGRAVHIHFRIIRGAYDAADRAEAAVISQLFFPEDVTKQIFANQPLYEDFGQPDTTLGTDNVVGGELDPSPYICDVASLPDGAMLASKTIILADDNSCQMQGAHGQGPPPGGGGPGGPPPGGPPPGPPPS